MPQPDPPNARALEFPEEAQRAEIDGSELAEVEEVQKDRNGCRGQPEQHQWIEECHRACGKFEKFRLKCNLTFPAITDILMNMRFCPGARFHR